MEKMNAKAKEKENLCNADFCSIPCQFLENLVGEQIQEDKRFHQRLFF